MEIVSLLVSNLPLFWENLPTSSFTLMPTLPFETNDSIPRPLAPFFCSNLKVRRRKDQLTLSYACRGPVNIGRSGLEKVATAGAPASTGTRP